ncbi:MAG: adenylate/guanylate cyclase domain-containing protein [Alphaproteobacteria bacterium]
MHGQTIDEIGRRLIGAGLVGTAEQELLETYCRELLGAGVPLLRANVALRTLHPVYSGHAFEWLRDRPQAKRENYERGSPDEQAKLWRRSPFFHIIKTRACKLRCRLTEPGGTLDFPLFDDLRGLGGTDYLALVTTVDGPKQNEAIITSFTADAPGGFTDGHIATLEALQPIFALAVKSAAHRRAASSVVETYLGRDAGRRVLRGEIQRGSVEKLRAVIWFCDMRGFTRIADTLPEEELIAMLNEYFECIVDPIRSHGGQVLKFMGDGLLATFELAESEEVCSRAMGAAEEALSRIGALNERRAALGQRLGQFSLTLHVGEVMYGNIGSRDRLDFTVVGPAVNLAARIDAMCRSLEQEIVISADFARHAGHCTDRLVSLGRYALRGVDDVQELFTLVRRPGREEPGARRSAHAPGHA